MCSQFVLLTPHISNTALDKHKNMIWITIQSYKTTIFILIAKQPMNRNIKCSTKKIVLNLIISFTLKKWLRFIYLFSSAILYENYVKWNTKTNDDAYVRYGRYDNDIWYPCNH